MTRRAQSDRSAAMLAVAGYRPPTVIGNASVAAATGTTAQWIHSRSGIESRRYVGAGETTLDLATEAASAAVAAAGLSGADIDCVIVATITHLLQTPACATMVAARIGSRAAAFDLSAACAGYCYGIQLARDLVVAGTAEHVLVVGADAMSAITDPGDRSTAFLFGDGAGAAVVGRADSMGIWPATWGSDGARAHLIGQRRSWTNTEAPGPLDGTLAMDGPAVFKWATTTVADVARDAMTRAGIGPGDLAAFVPHQANLRIVDGLARRIELPDTVVVADDVRTAGNTSAASIPLATHALLAKNPHLAGELALQVGFGAGLAFAAQVVRLPAAAA